MKAILNVTIYDYHTYLPDAFVLFDQTIVRVGLMSEYHGKGNEEIDGTGMLLMPGLINAHSHIYSTFARGVPVAFNPHSFRELLEQLWWKVDRNLNLKTVYHSALVAGVDYLKHGVTTIIDHHASGAIIGSLEQLHQALDKVGLRHALCFETSDRFDVEQCIQENRGFLNVYKTPKVRGHFGLHASFSLSEETLKNIKRHLKQDPIHIHVAESIEDQEDSLTQYNKRVIERLDGHGLIQPNSILTHCNHLNESEFHIVRDRKAVIAVNPTSNMNNGVGLPDVLAMRSFDIPVILGNDGIHRDMTREYQSLYYAMHHKYQSPTAFTLDHLRDIIVSTYDYASRLFGRKLGRIEQGAEADLVLIPYDHATPLDGSNILAHLFFGLFGSFHPKMVFVEGHQHVTNHNVSPSLQQVHHSAQLVATRLWQAIEKEGSS